jgi:hypothetical protein
MQTILQLLNSQVFSSQGQAQAQAQARGPSNMGFQFFGQNPRHHQATCPQHHHQATCPRHQATVSQSPDFIEVAFLPPFHLDHPDTSEFEQYFSNARQERKEEKKQEPSIENFLDSLSQFTLPPPISRVDQGAKKTKKLKFTATKNAKRIKNIEKILEKMKNRMDDIDGDIDDLYDRTSKSRSNSREQDDEPTSSNDGKWQLGEKCQTKVSGDWLIGKIVKMYNDDKEDVKLEMDNGEIIYCYFEDIKMLDDKKSPIKWNVGDKCQTLVNGKRDEGKIIESFGNIKCAYVELDNGDICYLAFNQLSPSMISQETKETKETKEKETKKSVEIKSAIDWKVGDKCEILLGENRKSGKISIVFDDEEGVEVELPSKEKYFRDLDEVYSSSSDLKAGDKCRAKINGKWIDATLMNIDTEAVYGYLVRPIDSPCYYSLDHSCISF